MVGFQCECGIDWVRLKLSRLRYIGYTSEVELDLQEEDKTDVQR